MTLQAEFHAPDINPDEDDWWWSACACGYINGPFLSRSDAEDDYSDHRGGPSWQAEDS